MLGVCTLHERSATGGGHTLRDISLGGIPDMSVWSPNYVIVNKTHARSDTGKDTRQDFFPSKMDVRKKLPSCLCADLKPKICWCSVAGVTTVFLQQKTIKKMAKPRKLLHMASLIKYLGGWGKQGCSFWSASLRVSWLLLLVTMYATGTPWSSLTNNVKSGKEFWSLMRPAIHIHKFFLMCSVWRTITRPWSLVRGW